MRITRKKSLGEIVTEKEALRRKVEEKMPRSERNLAQSDLLKQVNVTYFESIRHRYIYFFLMSITKQYCISQYPFISIFTDIIKQDKKRL